MLNHSLSSLLHGCFFPSVLGFTLLRVGQRIKNTHGCQRATVLVSFTKKASCHFQCSTQVSGIKSKTIKNQLQWNTIMWPTAAVTHILSLCQLALLQWPWRCLLGRGGGLGFGEKFLEGRIWAGAPQSIACHEQQRTMREALAVGDAPGGHEAAAPSPVPVPHSVSNHFHTHRSMKEGQWQTWNTTEELLSSIHWKLTPYWLMWRSNKVKIRREKEGGPMMGHEL